MKISTKGRYALRLMLDLAVYDTGEPVSLKDVAVRQNISEKYLEQIIGVLHRSGYVRSVRGAGGGAFEPARGLCGQRRSVTQAAGLWPLWLCSRGTDL